MAVIFPLDYAQAGTIIDDVRFLSLVSLTRMLTSRKRKFMTIWCLQFPVPSVQLPMVLLCRLSPYHQGAALPYAACLLMLPISVDSDSMNRPFLTYVTFFIT
jgi:hypothetical protein